jgi:hypothetical protein
MLNFNCEEDPLGVNSWIEFKLHEDRESLDFRLFVDGKLQDYFWYNLDKGQVGLFIDCFSRMAGR